MPDPISTTRITPVCAPAAAGKARAVDAADGGADFAGMLRQQLEKVNRMQAEADRNVEQLVSGQTQNLTEVFTAARKAQVAFSLLMEIRNKLTDAYVELRQMRV